MSYLWLCVSQQPGVSEHGDKGSTSSFTTQNKPIWDLGLGSCLSLMEVGLSSHLRNWL